MIIVTVLKINNVKVIKIVCQIISRILLSPHFLFLEQKNNCSYEAAYSFVRAATDTDMQHILTILRIITIAIIYRRKVRVL